MLSKILGNKIEELIALAQAEGDANTQIILLILRASKCIGVDGIIADEMRKRMGELLSLSKEQHLAHNN